MNGMTKMIDLVRAKRELPSDYAVADLMKVDRAVVSNWKRRNGADALNTLKLAREAGLTLDETISILEEKEPEQKKLFAQKGFISMSLILVTALLSMLVAASTLGSASLYIM